MTNQIQKITESTFKPIKANFIQLTDEKAFKREVNFAIQLIADTPGLQKCSVESVLKSVFNVSQTGLTLNPVLRYGYLIPRKNICKFEPGYQGLIKLATDTDNIESIEVQIVYEGDEVEIDLATNEKILKHVPYLLTGKEQGKILFVYSVALLKGGSKHVEIMSRNQIDDIREYSESYKWYLGKQKKNEWATCVWITDEPEMFRKTVVKRHFKYLPKSDNKHLEKAIEIDNEDYDFPASFEQGNYIENLLISAAIPEKVEREIYQTLHANDFTQKRAAECIQYLQDNQRDPVASGDNYQPTDIVKKLKNED